MKQHIIHVALDDSQRTLVAGILRPWAGSAASGGRDALSAMGLLTELQDFHRFARPRGRMAYMGLVPSEASSGDRERRGHSTKAGNTHVHRIRVEAAWHYRHPPRIGAALARRSLGQPPAVLTQAWQAQQRLDCRVLASGRAREKDPGRRGRHRP